MRSQGNSIGNPTVWAYIRVSGDEQADRGLPVAGQRRAILEYAEQHGLNVGRFFVDEARSGGTDRREQFQLMMRVAHEDPAPCTTILLWSWSRFARDQNDAHFWKASLRRHGIAIIAVDSQTPAVDGFEYVLESLIHWKDAQKLMEISHNARRGQQTLAKLGYVPSGGNPPRGYMVEFVEREIEGRMRKLRRWVPDPELWPLVERAWRMRLQGQSYAAILQETGLYSTPGCLSTFFANPIYKGELWFGGTLIQVAAVVTADEWANVNAHRAQRRGGAYPRQQGSRFLLSGLLRCARCGCRLYGDSSGAGLRKDGYHRARWDHYRCAKQRKGKCDLRRINARVLEAAVVQALFDEVLTEESLGQHLTKIESQIDAQRPALVARLVDLRKKLAQTETAIERVLDLIEVTADGRPLLPRLEKQQETHDRVTAEIVELETRLTHPVPMLDVRELRWELRESLADAPLPHTRALLGRLIADIIVDKDIAEVRYKIPFVPPTGVQIVPPMGNSLYPCRFAGANHDLGWFLARRVQATARQAWQEASTDQIDDEAHRLVLLSEIGSDGQYQACPHRDADGGTTLDSLLARQRLD